MFDFQKHPYFKPILKVSMLLLYIIIGCAYYHSAEGWSVGTTLSFTVVTITTVGYGYHHPTTDSSRMFTIFYILFGVYFVFLTVSEFILEKFDHFNKILKRRANIDEIESSYLFHRSVIIWNIIALLTVILIGALALMGLEGWSFIEALYFAVETSTTVGYGDLTIKNGNSTHAFMVFYIIFSVILAAFAVNNFNMVRAERKQLKRLEEMMEKRQHLDFISKLDKGSGISESEFILAVLEHIGTLDREKDIKPWVEKFWSISKDTTGKAFQKDLADFSIRESVVAKEEALRIETNINKIPRLFSLSSDASPSISLESINSPMTSNMITSKPLGTPSTSIDRV